MCVTFFNNVLSIWALGMAISLTLPKPHNTDPLGGRISHQPVAESPRAPSRKAEITVDAIRGQSGIKLGLSNECQHTRTQLHRSVVLADVWQAKRPLWILYSNDIVRRG